MDKTLVQPGGPLNAGGAQALTIQVYSPRLVSMTFSSFDPRRGLEPVQSELSDHPAVAPGPSRRIAV